MGYVMGKSEGGKELWHGHVTAVTVAPEYRRLGLAKQLMQSLEETSEFVYNCFFVDLFVRQSNSLAIGTAAVLIDEKQLRHAYFASPFLSFYEYFTTPFRQFDSENVLCLVVRALSWIHMSLSNLAHSSRSVLCLVLKVCTRPSVTEPTAESSNTTLERRMLLICEKLYHATQKKKAWCR